MRFFKIDKINFVKIIPFLFLLFFLFSPSLSYAELRDQGDGSHTNYDFYYNGIKQGTVTYQENAAASTMYPAGTQPNNPMYSESRTISNGNVQLGIEDNGTPTNTSDDYIHDIEFKGSLVSVELSGVNQVYLNSDVGNALIQDTLNLAKSKNIYSGDPTTDTQSLRALTQQNNANTAGSNQQDLTAYLATQSQLSRQNRLDIGRGNTDPATQAAASSAGLAYNQNTGKYETATQAKNSAGALSNAKDNGGNSGICLSLNWYGNLKFSFSNCVFQGLYYAVFWPASVLVGFAGWLFDCVFTYTVKGMSNGINQIGAIDIAWKTMRDLANICFIFILLYLAISTIIGAGEHDVKHTLSKLIVIAVLLNFSLFFTKVIIDASNILALSFFNSINIVNKNDPTAGLGTALMTAFRLQTLYDPNGVAGIANPDNGQIFAASNNHTAILLGGVITMLVATVILIASLIMFIKRYVILIIVMILSPLAFAGMVLHQTEHYAHEWWNTLLKEAFFAPLYMILIWISFMVIVQLGPAIGMKNQGTLGGAFTIGDNGIPSGGVNGVSVLLDFAIVSALLIFSLILAEKMGVAGAQQAMQFAQSAKGAIQNGAMFTGGAIFSNSVGRFAHTLVNKHDGVFGQSDTLARMQNGGGKLFSGVPVLGAIANYGQRQFARGVITLGNKAGKGFNESLKRGEQEDAAEEEESHGDDSARAERFARSMGDVGGIHSKGWQVKDRVYHGLSVDQQANMVQKWEDMEKNGTPEEKVLATKALDRYHRPHKDKREGKEGEITHYGRVSPERYNQIEKKMSLGTAFTDDQARKLTHNVGLAHKAFADAEKGGNAETIEKTQKALDEARKKSVDWVLNARSEGTIISSIDASGDESKILEDDKVYYNMMKNALKTKLSGENSYRKISSDEGIDPVWKNLAGDAAQEVGLAFDLHKSLNEGLAEDTKKMEELKTSLGKVKNQAIKDALDTGDNEQIVSAYKDFISSATAYKTQPELDGLFTQMESSTSRARTPENMRKLRKVMESSNNKALQLAADSGNIDTMILAVKKTKEDSDAYSHADNKKARDIFSEMGRRTQKNKDDLIEFYNGYQNEEMKKAIATNDFNIMDAAYESYRAGADNPTAEYRDHTNGKRALRVTPQMRQKTEEINNNNAGQFFIGPDKEKLYKSKENKEKEDDKKSKQKGKDKDTEKKPEEEGGKLITSDDFPRNVRSTKRY